MRSRRSSQECTIGDSFDASVHECGQRAAAATLTGLARTLPIHTGSYPASNGLAEHKGSILAP
jgi:hypothetical protein